MVFVGSGGSTRSNLALMVPQTVVSNLKRTMQRGVAIKVLR
jgi:hypothetical protein